MRIIQLVQKMQRRGAEIAAAQLAEAHRREGHNVCVVYLYPDRGPSAIEQLGPHDVCLEGLESSRFERLPGLNPVVLGRLVTLCRRFRPDIIQLNGGRTLKYGAAVALSRTCPNARLVYRNIGSPRTWLSSLPKRWVYGHGIGRLLDGIVAVSDTTLAEVRSLYAARVPAVAIGPGVDPGSLVVRRSKVELVGEGSATPVLLFVGSLSAEKRVDRLIQLIERLAVEGCDAALWIVGDGPLRRSLEESASSSSARARIKFWGSQSDVGSFYAAADLLLVSSDTEGVPAVILEAALCRTPTVAMNVGGISECLVSGQTGVLVPAGDRSALESAVLTLLGDRSALHKMGEAAHAFVDGHLTIDNVANRFLAFYEKL